MDDRFSFRSNDPNNYSPSFYHFRPSKTSVSRPGGSIRKESRSDSPFYKAGNSYTGKKMGFFHCFLFMQQEILISKVFSKAVKNHFRGHYVFSFWNLVSHKYLPCLKCKWIYLLLFWAKWIKITICIQYIMHFVYLSCRKRIWQFRYVFFYFTNIIRPYIITCTNRLFYTLYNCSKQEFSICRFY